VFGWGLTGVAASVLLSRTLETFVRGIPVRRWIRAVPRVNVPEALRKKMKVFSAQSMVLMVLSVVVWDRSEILFLKHYCPDIRQIAYYSVSFGMAENVLGVIRVFGTSIGTTMRAQFGRDKMGLLRMLPAAAGYIALLAFPLYFGLAALSRPTILLAYGRAYAPAIGVLIVTALLTVPKAFQAPLQSFLQASERQGFMVWWGLTSAGINLSLDWLLIPRYGAVGAAYGNGLAQLIAMAGLWIGAARMFDLQMPYRRVGRSLVCSLIMAAVVGLVSRPFGPLPAALVGIPVGILVFYLLQRLSPLLDKDDLYRLRQVRSSCPPAVRVWFDRAVNSIEVQSPRKTAA
jgi:O-antigen/teichoic acid export membrane protein